MQLCRRFEDNLTKSDLGFKGVRGLPPKNLILRSLDDAHPCDLRELQHVDFRVSPVSHPATCLSRFLRRT